MKKSRTHRRARARGRKRQHIVLATFAGIAVVAIGLSVTVAINADSQGESVQNATSLAAASAPEIQTPAPAETTQVYGALETTESPDVVEVPDFVGRSLAEVQLVASAAGISVDVVEDALVTPTLDGDARTVLAQEPARGNIVTIGSMVAVTVAPSVNPGPSVEGLVVCLDPGHQSHSDSSQEPIAPGAKETKDRIKGGTTGTTTLIPEYEITLQIALNLKARLEAEGIRVVMTRETNDVNISNAERAQIANEAGAALFVRIHGDGSPNPDASGISILYPASSGWTTSISSASADAATRVQSALVASTGAVNRGTVARDDITGFNWSEVPAILVECGFMSNPVEDKLLSSPHYQDKLATGMASGILDYLGR